MIVLAVDTCLEPGSLGLLREGGKLEVVALPPGWRSTALHGEIERLLVRHGLTPEDVTGYAATAGPGSFTGVRLGLTAVKGLAEVFGRPVFSLSTLEVLATAAKGCDQWKVTRDEQEQPGAELPVTGHSSLATAFAPVLDARRGQIFGAAYQVGPEGLRIIIPEIVCPLRVFLERIRAGFKPGSKALRFCAVDWAPWLHEMEERGWGADALLRVPPLLAGTLAVLALAGFRKGLGGTALAADANYVRASDAELFWKE